MSDPLDDYDKRFLKKRIETLKEMKKDHADNNNCTWAMGDLFEEYSVKFFPEDVFDLIDFTARREDLFGRKPKRADNPDFKYKCINSEDEFWVECKYTSELPKGQHYLCGYGNRFNQYKGVRDDTKTRLIFIWGVGGKAHEPEHVFCFDIDYMDPYGTVLCEPDGLHKVTSPFASMEDLDKIVIPESYRQEEFLKNERKFDKFIHKTLERLRFIYREQLRGVDKLPLELFYDLSKYVRKIESKLESKDPVAKGYNEECVKIYGKVERLLGAVIKELAGKMIMW